MGDTVIKVALIISVTVIIATAIVMYPTYKCMGQLNADGGESGFMCVTGMR